MYKVAIIEDDIAIQLMYKMKLDHAGFRTKTANDGASGLKLIEEFRPDVILLDLRMPHMSGDEMLARLRTMDWGSLIRVIVLTNISKTEAPPQLRLLSVDRYVVKAHTTPSEVVKIVHEVMKDKAPIDKN